MPEIPTLQFARPIAQVRVSCAAGDLSDGQPGVAGEEEQATTERLDAVIQAERARMAEELKQQKGQFDQLCETVGNIAKSLDQLSSGDAGQQPRRDRQARGRDRPEDPHAEDRAGRLRHPGHRRGSPQTRPDAQRPRDSLESGRPAAMSAAPAGESRESVRRTGVRGGLERGTGRVPSSRHPRES